MNRYFKWLEGTKSKSFHDYIMMWLMAWICGLILTLFLFLRPTPYATDYVMDIWRYMPHAIFYMTFGLTVICAPFMFVSLLIRSEDKPWRHRIFQMICAVLLALSLLYEHVDNEILRFCNMHISPDFLRTYVLSQGVPDALWDLLATDPGGSNLSLWLLGIPAVFLVSCILAGYRIPMPKRFGRWLQWAIFGCIFISFVFLPILLRTDLFGSKNRQAKVAPPVILIMETIRTWNLGRHFPDNMPERLADAQQNWSRYNHAPWVMTDPQRPWLRHYNGECPKPDKTYNILIIVFESFRAQSLTLFNPHETFEATPWFNRFAQSENAAYYTDYYTNGHPTIAAFMALHTSLLPHSNKTVAKAYTSNQLESFVNTLRKHGYQTAFFGGSDPDWDNQRPWLVRWYDEISFKPENDERDRLVMHDIAHWLKSERDPNKPFVLTTFLISNHMPFHLREENLRVTDSEELIQKIYNTMHYDDDVLREFIESIQNEPWFDDTIIFLTGDHGMDLGDRGSAPDYNNLRTEAIHIPLVIYGKHPRIPHGKQTQPGSHIDLGPTILDLTGICDDTTAHGHSLLDIDPERPVYAIKYGRYTIFEKDWSAYVLEDDAVMLYRRNDILQQNDISKQYPDEAGVLFNHIKDISTVVDYSYMHHLTDN